MIADQQKHQAVRVEIDRQNTTRVWIIAAVAMFFMPLFLSREWAYLSMGPEELGAVFGVPRVDPVVFHLVVGFRLATFLAAAMIGLLVFRWRYDPVRLGGGVAAFVLLVGWLLIAMATLSLAIRLSSDLFYLKIFIVSAMFFLRPWLSVVFFTGALLIYLLGAQLVMAEFAVGRVGALYTNATIMAGLAMVIAIQNYRIKFRELAALQDSRLDNQALQQANRAITLSSETDSLTKVFNRRALDRDLAQLHSKRVPYVLAMLDLDHFKPYNDHYGHQAGDRALQAVADILKNGLKRRTDRVYRYGGEEFVVLLRDTDLAGGQVAMEALRQQVEALAIEHAFSDDSAAVVTVSIGLAESDGQAPEAVLKLADQRLYQSKHDGRNRLTPA